MSIPIASSALAQSVKSGSFTALPNPVRSFSSAKKECAVSSLAYGQCMLAGYKDVERGMCQAEFEAFKGCVQKSIGRKW